VFTARYGLSPYITQIRFVSFSSAVRQMPGYTMRSRGTASAPLPPRAAASPKRLTKVAYLQFATEPLWAQNPDSQPTKVYPPIISPGPPRS
jgi:hypothetical protein